MNYVKICLLDFYIFLKYSYRLKRLRRRLYPPQWALFMVLSDPTATWVSDWDYVTSWNTHYRLACSVNLLFMLQQSRMDADRCLNTYAMRLLTPFWTDVICAQASEWYFSTDIRIITVWTSHLTCGKTLIAENSYDLIKESAKFVGTHIKGKNANCVIIIKIIVDIQVIIGNLPLEAQTSWYDLSDRLNDRYRPEGWIDRNKKNWHMCE